MSIFPKLLNYTLKFDGDDCHFRYLQVCPHLILLTFVQQDQEEGVSRVRVTSRRSPHKVERVSGLVTSSHVDIPKVSKTKQKGSLSAAAAN